MATFDSTRHREIGEWSIEFMKTILIGPSTPLGSYGKHDVDRCIYLWLVGYSEQSKEYLHRAIEWTDQAVHQKEGDWFGMSPSFHNAQLLEAKAVAYWMLHGENAILDWQQAVEYQIGAKDIHPAYPENQVATAWLDDFMAYVFQAGEYEKGITEYERYHEGKVFSLSRALRPKDFGYALCLNGAKGLFDAQQLQVVGERVLKSNLQSNWLGMGQATRSAMWLKIVYSDLLKIEDPLTVIMKAYDNMPKVAKPDWVQ